MAVDTLRCVYVVRALGIEKRGIHLFHVQPAVRQPRMAAAAGLPGLLAVVLMAGQTTDSFMDSERSAIVAGARLRRSERRVALITKRLPLVRAHPYAALPFEHDWQGKHRRTDVHPRTPVEQTQ